MRSRPYTPPPPLPPLLAELATLLPNREREGDRAISLLDLNPDTSRLLPAKERPQHCVRVQGRLTPVRSVSVANLRSPSQTRFDTAVSGPPARPRRRRSSDDVNREMGGESRERDAQLRGYGIGGRGNIREFPPLYKINVCLNTHTHSRSAHRGHRDTIRLLLIRALALLKYRLNNAPLILGARCG
ncbi:hypothetical protein F4814DRAFT_453538 [Daldinia grandis]|nr:hypothetical protein F4814DRAFT_453538 [Daldinia grandis]